MSMLLTRRPARAAIAPTSLFTEPFRLLTEMNSWDPFLESGPQTWGSLANFLPAFELKETPTELIVKADLPGIPEKNLELSVVGNRLMISGKREEEKVHDDEICHLVERTHGSFQRTITLPEDVDANAIKAQLKEGVLSINIPKSPAIQPRKIGVKTS